VFAAFTAGEYCSFGLAAAWTFKGSWHAAVWKWRADADNLVRDADTLLMVQPNLIKKSDVRVILSAAGNEGRDGIKMQVAGHKPMTCETDAQLNAYRQLKPQDVAIHMAIKLRRPSGIEYTL
jgi:hypothetical protein